ncbi:MAG TPA: arylamine N-acetyltransferase [Devosia sp.]|nr:arylamine N-acetyltransferase [Devosia sp.]
MGDAVRLNAYFERIGFAGSIAPTLETLEALHALQPAALPFENLDFLLGVPIRLDQANLERKLIDERRGGFCAELNLLLLRVLLELGFEARAHLATALFGSPRGADAAPDHLLLSVDIAGTTWLADAGFGGLIQAAPLKFRPALEQETSLGTYRVSGDGPGYELQFRREGDWWPVYRFTLDPAGESEAGELAKSLMREPHGFLREHLLVERAGPGGRVRLFDTRLNTESGEGREERFLDSVGEIRDTLAGVFGIAPPAEGLDPILGRLLTRSMAAG